MLEEIIKLLLLQYVSLQVINASFLCIGNSEYNLNMDSIVIILNSRKNILLCNYYDYNYLY